MAAMTEMTIRFRAEAADEFTARILGLTFTPCPPSREGGMCGCDESAEGPVLHLPEHMAGAGAAQIAMISDAWSEIFPGLQARLHSPGDVTVTFRLTPKDGQDHD